VNPEVDRPRALSWEKPKSKTIEGRQMSERRRAGIVPAIGWVRHTVNALRFVIAGEVRVFPANQSYQGCA
jgi:predicted NBD/HSP70 family sugar kinase